MLARMVLIVNDFNNGLVIDACLVTNIFNLLQFTILRSRPNKFMHNDNVPC